MRDIPEALGWALIYLRTSEPTDPLVCVPEWFLSKQQFVTNLVKDHDSLYRLEKSKLAYLNFFVPFLLIIYVLANLQISNKSKRNRIKYNSCSYSSQFTVFFNRSLPFFGKFFLPRLLFRLLLDLMFRQAQFLQQQQIAKSTRCLLSCPSRQRFEYRRCVDSFAEFNSVFQHFLFKFFKFLNIFLQIL